MPLALSAGFVIEEGFPVADLRRIAALDGARGGGRSASPIATGDTKVVERGNADGVYVNTAGIGVVAADVELGPERVRPGDRVLVSGTLGDHGMAVMIARGELELEVDLESDTAPVHELAAALLELGDAVRWMRDPTRGGLATALNELARQAGVAVALDEAGAAAADRRSSAPARSSASTRSTSPTRASSSPSSRPSARRRGARALRSAPARRRGRDRRRDPRRAARGSSCWTPRFGGSRIVDMLVGDPLPRIC